MHIQQPLACLGQHVLSRPHPTSAGILTESGPLHCQNNNLHVPPHGVWPDPHRTPTVVCATVAHQVAHKPYIKYICEVADKLAVIIIRGIRQPYDLHDVVAPAEQQAAHLIADDAGGIGIAVVKPGVDLITITRLNPQGKETEMGGRVLLSLCIAFASMHFCDAKCVTNHPRQAPF